jgi:hypothetical protein
MGNPLAWARSTTPVISMSQPGMAKEGKETPNGQLFFNGSSLVCLLVGFLVVWWKRDFHFYIFSIPRKTPQRRHMKLCIVHSMTLIFLLFFSPLFNNRFAVNWAHRQTLNSFESYILYQKEKVTPVDHRVDVMKLMSWRQCLEGWLERSAWRLSWQRLAAN